MKQIIMLLLFLAFSEQACAQWIKNPSNLRGPYIDSEPFDVIYLNEKGANAILKVLPLKKPVPKPPFTGGSLIFEYFEENEDRLEVPLSSVEKIVTFDQLLLQEADTWIRQKDYTKAFRNFLYVYDHGGRGNSKLENSLRACMFRDGKANFESGEFELALSIYEDIYQRQPNFKVREFPNTPLSEIVMACYDGIIQKKFDQEKYIEVRDLLDKIVQKYNDSASNLQNKWLAEFKKKSDALLQQATSLANENRGREAHLAAKQADQMYPDREDVLEFKKELLNRFPLIVVGVSQDGADANPGRIEHFGSRRVGRLTQRTMIELSGLSDEGGEYEFLNGLFYRSDEIGLEYTFEIKEDSAAAYGIPPITAYEVASRLYQLADPESQEYNLSWAKVVSEISILDETRVKVALRSAYVRPEGLLKVAYYGGDQDLSKQRVKNGAYVVTAQDNDVTTFEINPTYGAIENRQHPAIVEQLFDSAGLATEQLIAGNIDVVDRVPPADVKRLKKNKSIEVRPYLLPTVHMLVPKIRGEVAKDPAFKSGLSHAINRPSLIRDMICGGEEISGCEPISGPFPIGTEENDQIAYGYDLKVRQLPYDSQLGMVLIQLALRAKPPSRPEPLPMPSIVLAHSTSSTATQASEAIIRAWSEIGVKATTRKLKPGETVPPDDDWDLLYLEALIEEPLADAPKLIGPQGFAKNVSAPIEQSLRILSYSESWQGTCSTLRRLHRQIAIDLSIIPLWQVREHYAYRTTVREIGRDLIHLYQNVDRWKIDLIAEAEADND